jgi:hypothetical protein
MRKFFQAYEKVCKKDKGRLLGVETIAMDLSQFAWRTWAYIVMHVDWVCVGGLFVGVRALQ